MTKTILLADAGYDAAAAALAAEYSELNIIAPGEDDDLGALASSDVVGLIADTATVDESLLDALPNSASRAQAGPQLFQH